jgi:hypothetical protein
MKRTHEEDMDLFLYYLPGDLVGQISYFLDYASLVSFFWVSKDTKRAITHTKLALTPQGWSCFVLEATKNIYLNLLRWGHKNGCTIRMCRGLGEFAIGNGSLRLLEFLIKHDELELRIIVYVDLLHSAIKSGFVDIIEWLMLLEKGRFIQMTTFSCPLVICGCAAKYGHTQVLEYMKDKLGPKNDISILFSSDIFSVAAESEQLNVCEWLLDNGCPPTLRMGCSYSTRILSLLEDREQKFIL